MPKKPDRVTAEDVRRVMRVLGSRGGSRRMDTLTPERRSEIARAGAKAMWRKRRAKERAGSK
jgi:hypothetical protein